MQALYRFEEGAVGDWHEEEPEEAFEEVYEAHEARLRKMAEDDHKQYLAKKREAEAKKAKKAKVGS